MNKMKAKLLVPVVAGLLLFSGCSNESNDKASADKQVEQNNQVKIEEASINNFGNKRLEVEVKATGDNLKYAYYVHKDGKVIKKTSYSTDSSFKYPLEKSGKYAVRVFVKAGDNKSTKSTDAVSVTVAE